MNIETINISIKKEKVGLFALINIKTNEEIDNVYNFYFSLEVDGYSFEIEEELSLLKLENIIFFDSEMKMDLEIDFLLKCFQQKMENYNKKNIKGEKRCLKN
jgi:hypothetical protein